MPMIFVLTMLFTFFYDRKNENHRSLLIIRYSLLITRNTNTISKVLLHNAIKIFVSCICALKSIKINSPNT